MFAKCTGMLSSGKEDAVKTNDSSLSAITQELSNLHYMNVLIKSLTTEEDRFHYADRNVRRFSSVPKVTHLGNRKRGL